MRPRSLAYALALGLAGCGLGAPEARTPARNDAALALAERLPAGVDQCVVARVGRLGPARRRALAELSEAGPLAWLPGAPVVAYALGAQPSDDGKAFVTLLRTSVPAPEARRYFEGARGARLRFDDQLLCEDGVCRPVSIDFVEPTLLRVRRGTIEARGPGRERRCRELLAARPRALEVAAQLADPFLPGARVSSPLSSESYLEARGEGIEVQRIDLYADPVFAATAARLQEVLPPESGWITVADPIRRVARGEALRFTARVTWQDLALRAQDVARLRRATTAEMGLAWRIVPLESIDVRHLDGVDRQVYIRRERLLEAPDAEVAALAEELRALLERVLAIHPQEERFSEALFDVLLGSLGDARGAAQAAEHALGHHPAEPEAWRRRFREALLRFDLVAAGAALEEAGLATRGRGRETGRLLRALVDAEVPYALAEGAVQATDRLERLEPVARFPEPALVAWSALAETAVALFELEGPLPSADRLLVLVRGAERGAREAPPGFVDFGRDGPGAPRRATLALAPMDDRRGLRALGRSLGEVAGEGPLSVAFAVVAEDGTFHPADTMLGLHGRASAGGLRVAAALGAPFAWRRIPRLLSEPLDRMLPARRPQPSWSADVADDEELRTIEERLEPWPEIECADEGSRVVCRSELTGSGLRRAWARIVEPLIR